MSDETHEVVMSQTRHTRTAKFNIDGFWPVDTVTVTKDKNKASELNWSEGGRDHSVPPLDAARNFGNAILAAVELAEMWDE